MRFITTSWDDGFTLDLKLAELLSKYNLQATFYIPKRNLEREVLAELQIVELSKYFEIGGHTLDHQRLDIYNKAVLQQQIAGCFKWLKELLGYDPVSFCFPKGKYNRLAFKAVFDIGFKLARTTELLGTKGLYKNNLAPTTLQLHEHPKFTFIKNPVIRGRWFSVIKWMRLGSMTDTLKLTETYLKDVLDNGGCLHLWGHSWEINDWKKLEQIFKIISNLPEVKYIQNKELVYN